MITYNLERFSKRDRERIEARIKYQEDHRMELERLASMGKFWDDFRAIEKAGVLREMPNAIQPDRKRGGAAYIMASGGSRR